MYKLYIQTVSTQYMYSNFYIFIVKHSQYKTCINASSISVYEGGTVVMYLHSVLYSAGRGGLAIYLAWLHRSRDNPQDSSREGLVPFASFGDRLGSCFFNGCLICEGRVLPILTPSAQPDWLGGGGGGTNWLRWKERSFWRYSSWIHRGKSRVLHTSYSK